MSVPGRRGSGHPGLLPPEAALQNQPGLCSLSRWPALMLPETRMALTQSSRAALWPGPSLGMMGLWVDGAMWSTRSGPCPSQQHPPSP